MDEYMWQAKTKICKEEDYKGTSTSDHFLSPKFHLKAFRQLRELTIFDGDTLEHVHCAIHNLEKQSVVVVVDDDGGNDNVVNAANDDNDDGSGNEEDTENLGDNDEL